MHALGQQLVANDRHRLGGSDAAQPADAVH